MLIDKFINEEIAISIIPDGSIRIPEDLAILEREIDDAVGDHVSCGRYASGFAEYCIKTLAVAKEKYNIDGIEVCLSGGGFEFMQAGTTYFQDEEGMAVIDAAELLEEFSGSSSRPTTSEDNFFEVLN